MTFNPQNALLEIPCAYSIVEGARLVGRVFVGVSPLTRDLMRVTRSDATIPKDFV